MIYDEMPYSKMEYCIEAQGYPELEIDITENGEYDVKKFAKANVNVSGGGSSDFSTAKVTFINSSKLQFKFNIPCAFDWEEGSVSYGVINYELIGSGTTINAILYKGHCYVSLSPIGQNTPNIEVSGGIEDMGHENYLITGDCTITIEGNGGGGK